MKIHETLQRAQQTLTERTDAGEQVTVALLANRAGVSRSWIYTQPALRDRLRQLQQHQASSGFGRDTITWATDDSLRQRLARAHERITQLRTENQQLSVTRSRTPTAISVKHASAPVIGRET